MASTGRSFTPTYCRTPKFDGYVSIHTDERVVYLSGPSNEVESYHVYTKKTYSSGRKRSKKR